MDRVDLPKVVTVEWAIQQAARILLGAETVIENGDRVATYKSMSEAWLAIAEMAKDE